MVKSETHDYDHESMGLIFPNDKNNPIITLDAEKRKTYDLETSEKFRRDKICAECGIKTEETGASDGRWAIFYHCPGCNMNFMQQAAAQGQEPWLSVDKTNLK
jgi:hypothetical protein